MSCKCTSDAKITSINAIGSTASPYFINNIINQKLCAKVCEDNIPVFQPTFTFKSISTVGTNQYALNCHVQGVISYIPFGNCSGNTRQIIINEDFVVPLYSANEIESVVLTQGTTTNSLNTSACRTCSKEFTSVTPLSFTVTTA